MDQGERKKFLIRELLQENAEYQDMKIPSGEEEQKRLLRGLMNIRPPRKIGRVLSFLSGAGGRKSFGKRGILLYLDRGISFSE